MKLNRVEVGGMLLLAGGLVFVLGISISMSAYPGYQFSGNQVVDLGGLCTYGPDPITPQVCVFEQPAFTLYLATKVSLGVLILGGVCLLLPLAERRRPFIFLGIGSMGVFGSLLNLGTVQVIFSLVAFLFGALAAVDSWRIVRRPIGFFNLTLGCISLLAISLTIGAEAVAPGWKPLGQEGVVWMAIYPDILWLIVFGATLVTSPGSVTRSSELVGAAALPRGPATADASVPGRSAKPPV